MVRQRDESIQRLAMQETGEVILTVEYLSGEVSALFKAGAITGYDDLLAG
jgi:hypothetical protein